MRITTLTTLLPVAAALTLHHPTTAPRAGRPVACAPPADEDALLALLESSGSGDRGKTLGPAELADVHRLATALESTAATGTDTNDDPLLPGRWRVLYQGKPGTTTSFFSVESWQKYLSGDGPSPVQNLVSGSSTVSRLYQVVEIAGETEGRVNNVVDFSPTGVIAIEADLEGRPQPNRLAFRFTGGRVLLRALWNGTLDLPYPVPFDLLGDNAKGWLQTEYLSPKLRLSRGNKGSLFVLTPETEPDDPELEALLQPPPPSSPPPSPEALAKDPVLVCPAQFGTAGDYEELTRNLEERGHPTSVVPLKFTDWLRLIPASLTPEYWQGNLRAEVALPFYFEALDKAVDEMRAAHPGKPIQLVAHSIGGWIVRAYLGQLPAERRKGVFGALVTLGTPHAPPPEGIFRTLDQTRGLLTNVEGDFPGAFHKDEGLRYLTVGSRAVTGQPSLGAGLDGALAFASYLPLCGDGAAEGDGITPLRCAHLDGAEQREVDAFHIAFVPGIGTRLRGTPWYGSAELIDGWADFLR